ncbi:MAG TPA: GNAT family N-acetyltransferase [Burkholderiales bacterium]|nr:GNAT family N-acetyltransferase [Burkholderiales bacterium]
MNRPAATDLRITPVIDADIEPVCALAREIWMQHYPGIITVAQINYMLAQRYVPEAIRAQLREGGAWWKKAEAAGVLCGFSSFERGAAPASMKLDKLYVHQLYRGRGYGAALIEDAVAAARREGMDTLYLQVNKYNHGSVAAYLRTGFVVAKTVKVDIGGGFFMDDYVMSRSLAA